MDLTVSKIDHKPIVDKRVSISVIKDCVQGLCDAAPPPYLGDLATPTLTRCMHHPLQALRNALEHELAVYGPYVPLGESSPGETASAMAKTPPPAKADETPAEKTHAEGAPAAPPGSLTRTTTQEDTPPKRRFRVINKENAVLSGTQHAAPQAVSASVADAPPAAPPPAPPKPAPPPFEVKWTPPGAAIPATSASLEASVDTMANLDLFGQEVDPSKDPSRPFWERIHALVPSADHGRRAVGVVAAEAPHLVPAHALEARPDVGLNVLHQVSQVDVAVDVGQGVGDEDLTRHGGGRG